MLLVAQDTIGDVSLIQTGTLTYLECSIVVLTTCLDFTLLFSSSLS